MNVLMPQLGETVTEGTVANWHKKVGDKVVADEIILDIETDKVSMEIPSPGNGYHHTDPRARRHDGRGGNRDRRRRGQHDRCGRSTGRGIGGDAGHRCARTHTRRARRREPTVLVRRDAAGHEHREGTVRAARRDRRLGCTGCDGHRRSRCPRQPPAPLAGRAPARGRVPPRSCGRTGLGPQRPDHAPQRARVHPGTAIRADATRRPAPHRRRRRAGRHRSAARGCAPPLPRRRRRPEPRRCRSRASASSRPSTWSARRPRARTCCKPSRWTSTASTSCARPCATRGRRSTDTR